MEPIIAIFYQRAAGDWTHQTYTRGWIFFFLCCWWCRKKSFSMTVRQSLIFWRFFFIELLLTPEDRPSSEMPSTTTSIVSYGEFVMNCIWCIHYMIKRQKHWQTLIQKFSKLKIIIITYSIFFHHNVKFCIDFALDQINKSRAWGESEWKN